MKAMIPQNDNDEHSAVLELRAGSLVNIFWFFF